MLKPDTAPLPLEDGKASTTGVKHTVYRTVNEPDKEIAKANEQDNSSEPSLADTDPGVEKWAKADADLRRKLYGELPEQATILGVVHPKAKLMHCKCGQIQTTWMPMPCGERNAEGIKCSVYTFKEAEAHEPAVGTTNGAGVLSDDDSNDDYDAKTDPDMPELNCDTESDHDLEQIAIDSSDSESDCDCDAQRASVAMAPKANANANARGAGNVAEEPASNLPARSPVAQLTRRQKKRQRQPQD